MYKEHPSVDPPPQQAVLWRYMDLTKFVSLLKEEALFFARIDKLGDPFEGSLGKVTEALRAERFRDNEAARLRAAMSLKEVRAFTLASCWHWADYESEAMWKLYSKVRTGIAIRTDFESLSASFICAESIYIGKVKYVDYDDTLIPDGSLFISYLHKRKSFEHEREVRALVQALPPGEGAFSSLDAPYDVGAYRAVDLSRLIHKVLVDPYADDWYLELVQSVADRYGMNAPIRRSSLADEPTWG